MPKLTASLSTPTGKLVVAGDLFIAGSYASGAARLRPLSGHLDRSFGDDGTVELSSYASENRALSVSIQQTGSSYRIVLGGLVYVEHGSDWLLAALDSTGSVDVSFGNAGYLQQPTWQPGCSGSYNEIDSIEVESDGRILAGGDGCIQGDGDPTLARLGKGNAISSLENDESGFGTSDTWFGPTGRLAISVGAGGDRARAITVDNDGRLLLAGTAGAVGLGAIDDSLALVRLDRS